MDMTFGISKPLKLNTNSRFTKHTFYRIINLISIAVANVCGFIHLFLYFRGKTFIIRYTISIFNDLVVIPELGD